VGDVGGLSDITALQGNGQGFEPTRGTASLVAPKDQMKCSPGRR